MQYTRNKFVSFIRHIRKKKKKKFMVIKKIFESFLFGIDAHTFKYTSTIDQTIPKKKVEKSKIVYRVKLQSFTLLYT